MKYNDCFRIDCLFVAISTNKFCGSEDSGFDDSEDGRLNLFGLVNGIVTTEVGYPQLIAEFDSAEPYDWGE